VPGDADLYAAERLQPEQPDVGLDHGLEAGRTAHLRRPDGDGPDEVLRERAVDELVDLGLAGGRGRARDCGVTGTLGRRGGERVPHVQHQRERAAKGSGRRRVRASQSAPALIEAATSRPPGLAAAYSAGVLFSERKRNEGIAEREAAGEVVWRDEIGARARVRLLEVAEVGAKLLWEHRQVDLGATVAARLRGRIGRSTPGRLDLLFGNEDHVVILDWLGAAHEVLADEWGADEAEPFADVVNKVFREERIAYKFVDGVIVEFASDELNIEVVEPAVRLLVSKQFDAAHGAYMDALKELTNGKPGDAITDAGTALQETLTALGCEGDVLSTLIRDAKARGLFKSHDQQLHEALLLVMKWAASERNKGGDAHKRSSAALADAWFIVHVVGALIVRLVDPTPRGRSLAP
jgi:hypothetical protein